MPRLAIRRHARLLSLVRDMLVCIPGDTHGELADRRHCTRDDLERLPRAAQGLDVLLLLEPATASWRL